MPSDNVIETVPHVIMKRLADCDFVAHDENETVLQSGPAGWYITNKNGLYLCYDNFIRAIGDLYALTGKMGFSVVTQSS